MSCSCDYDQPDFYVKSRRLARKQHRCEECSYRIQPGERYEHVSAKWDGSISVMKTCANCLGLRDWVEGNVPCACWVHGDMLEGLREAIDDAVYRAPDETRGLRFGYLRRLYQWEWRAGHRCKKASQPPSSEERPLAR